MSSNSGICFTYAYVRCRLIIQVHLWESIVRTVSIFKNGKNQAVRLPKDMEYEGVSELEIIKEGDTIVLRPSKPSWISLAETEKADEDFLIAREDVIDDEGRF